MTVIVVGVLFPQRVDLDPKNQLGLSESLQTSHMPGQRGRWTHTAC
jgi:hypothetical protein